MASKQEDDSVSRRSPDRAGEESLTSSRSAPETKPVDDTGRNASELLGGYKYHWNDPDVAKKLMQNDTERQNSADTSPVAVHGGEESRNPTAPGGERTLSDTLGIEEMSPEEARSWGLDKSFPELRIRKRTENDSSTQPCQPPPNADRSQPSSMDFLGRLMLDESRFPSSDPELATESSVRNEQAAANDGNPQSPPSTRASRSSPPPPPPPPPGTAYDAPEGDIPMLDVSKLCCSKIFAPDSRK